MQDIAFGISHEVSVRLFAGFDAVDDPVHPVAQFAVFDPAQLVARTHQKATRFRTGQNVDPFGMQVAQCPVRRYSGPLAELFQHIVYGKRLKQVMGVGIERSAEQSVVYGDAAARNPRRRFDRPPACRRSDVFGTIQYGDFSHRALRSQQGVFTQKTPVGVGEQPVFRNVSAARPYLHFPEFEIVSVVAFG